MQITLFRRWEDLTPWREAWNRCAEAQAATGLFLRFEWLEAWWRTFGQSRPLYVIGVFEGDEFLGAAPCWMQEISLIFFKRRWLRFLADEASDYCGLLFKPQRQADVVHAILDHLSSNPQDWHGLRLKEVPQPAAQILTSLFSGRGLKTDSRKSAATLHLALTGTWDHYFSRLSKRLRQALRRLESTLSCAEFRLINGPDMTPELLQEVIELNQQGPASRLDSSLFLDPRYRALHVDRLRNSAFGRHVKFALLWIGGRLASYNYLFDYEKTLLTYQGNYNQLFAALSPGLFLDMQTIRHGFQHGYQMIDFLRGDYHFKQRYLAETQDNFEVTVYRSWANRALLSSLLWTYQNLKTVYSRWGVPVKKNLRDLPKRIQHVRQAQRRLGWQALIRTAAQPWLNRFWHHSESLRLSSPIPALRTYATLPVRSNHWICRELTLQDIPVFESLYSARPMAEVVKRFWKKDRCWGVMDQNQLVGYAWITDHDCQENDSDITVTVNHGNLYLYDAWVDPSQRGKGLMVLLLNQLFTDQSLNGYASIFTLVDVGNRAMQKTISRFNFKIDCRIERRKRLGLINRHTQHPVDPANNPWPLDVNPQVP